MTLRRSISRSLAALGLTSSLLAAAMAGPTLILGAQADAIQTATALPGTVSPGADVAFDVSFQLAPDETSTLSQLFLKAITPNGATLLEVEAPGPSQGVCDITGPVGGDAGADLACSFGAVEPGVEVTLRVVYETPDTGTSMTVNFDFNTTGVSADRPGRSHGDAYRAVGTVLLDDSDDFAGGYIRAGDGAETISDTTELHARRNPQYTQVTAPEDGIGVMVGELPGDFFVCPAEASTCFGQWSLISVNDGAPYPGGFTAVLGYQGNIGNASFIHAFDNYDPDDPSTYELIKYPEDLCSNDPTLPCMELSTSGGDSFVTLYLTVNGFVKSY